MKAYLDIETDRKGNICVIGIFIEHNGFVQLHGEDITTDNLEMIMRKAKTVVTFYGDSFDLPVIKRYFNLDLKVTHHSLDLFKVKKGLGIKGGLKELEKMFGIKRKTEGINGYKAMLLWERYIRKGKIDALNLLLEYNKEDVLNLISLESCLASLENNRHD
ncbi:MAG: ribonuclease H-like domain-containing protein [Proteobacteria bacterium]|nr:ribonuclease H-like domain-containing protein [Pseudomonadota bacterium]